MELDFDLAWKRVKNDIKNECFFPHTFEISFIEQNLDCWLKNLKTKVFSNEYYPDKMSIIDVPKPNWNLRPGSVLSVKDMVVYSALILSCIKKIDKQILNRGNVQKFSNVLKDDQSGADWFEFKIDGWKKFNNKSLELIKDQYKYVLFSDISGFFENIDIGRLISDLDTLNINTNVKNILSLSLNRWAETSKRGIPQGFSPSHILADLYLSTIDKRLSDEGITCLRYSDDTRCFFKSKKDAIKALHLLTKLYRQKGLNIQTAKTYIKKAKQAEEEIDDVLTIIEKLDTEWIKEFREHVKLYGPYFSRTNIKDIYKTKNEKINPKSLITVFDMFFLSGKENFNKSLFHFLIYRFGLIKNSHALTYSLECILLHPEETPFILKYFSCFPDEFGSISNYLAKLLEEDNILYEYQYFLILDWIIERKIKSEKMLSSIRYLLGNNQLNQYVVDLCIVYLGDFGDISDLDRIESLYDNDSNSIRKGIIMYSLRRLPKDRRSSIYARTKNDHEYVRCAMELANKNLNKNT